MSDIDNFKWLDHVVLAAPDLRQGIQYVEDLTGCSVTNGGRHAQFGTHNALLKIGNLAYLEILAPDPSNVKDQPLWMGVQEITEPTITRIAVKSANIKEQAKLLAEHSSGHGQVQEGLRKKPDGTILSWQLSLPLALPSVTCTPFLIDWGNSAHPASGLNVCCKLNNLELFSPDPTFENTIFTALNIKSLVQPGPETIVMTLDTPKGTIKL